MQKFVLNTRYYHKEEVKEKVTEIDKSNLQVDFTNVGQAIQSPT